MFSVWSYLVRKSFRSIKASGTLKDAVNEALRYWVANVEDTHYILGSALGPHPFPRIVRDFQRVIGVETRRQIVEKEGRLPDAIVACIGGGSNAIGMFHPFIEDEEVALYGVEAAGSGIDNRTSCGCNCGWQRRCFARSVYVCVAR